MKTLNIIVMVMSIISILFFIGITFIRVHIARTQAKKYGMKKQVTDPWLYWFSYISSFIIIVIKIIIWSGVNPDIETNIWLTEIIPSIALIVFARTIGKSVIMRAEKQLYFNHLLAETKDIDKFVKEDNKWMLYTSKGKYPVSLTNTTVMKIADITGAKVEKENKEKKKEN